MFVRIKKSANNLSAAIQIVENCRIANTTKQKVIRHVGTAHTPEEIERMKSLAEIIKAELELNERTKIHPKNSPQFATKLGRLSDTKKNQPVNIFNLEETRRSILGVHDIYGYLYDSLGFTNLFTRPHQRETAAQILREIVLARIAFPASKRSTVDLLKERFDVALKLDHVYQMMDKMDETFYERIQQRALAETLKLTGGKLRVLFYDATTLYFESFSEDEFKQNGYSKDMKFNQPQVLLALFVTENGLPVGYEVFPGSTFEGHTLIPVLEKLRQRYQLEEVVFVADRGLFSEANLAHLEKNNFKYIVGARIKNMSKKLKDAILNLDNYVLSQEEIEQKTAVFEAAAGRKVVVNYSSERARKDQHDRAKAIEKLRQKVAKSKDPKSLLNNYGYKKYIKISGKTNISVNEEKLEQDAQWDGLAGVITNIKDMSPQAILAHYHGLWQVEESFRISKHDLKIRPVYHWTPQRIKAHLAITFIAFVCIRHLEYRLTLQSQKLSPEVIRKTLLQVQASIVKDKESEKTYLLPSQLSPHAKEIYRVIGIKPPNCITEIQCSA